MYEDRDGECENEYLVSMTQPSTRSRKSLISILTIALAVFLGIFPAVSASAVGTLDQQATGTSTRWYYNMNNIAVGQVFTAGITGQLDRISIDALSFQSATTAPLVATIFAVDGSGFPTGSALASSSVSHTAIPGTVTTVAFDFTSPASVSAGTAYAIVFTTTGSGEYHFENATTVPAGAKGIKPGSGNVGWQNYVDSGVSPNQTSFRFATYVTPTVAPSASTSAPEDPTLVRTGVNNSEAMQLAGLGVLFVLAGGVVINTVRARARQK